MPDPIKAYRCKYKCGKIGTQKARIADHESRCFNNPQSRSCKTCDHLSEIESLSINDDLECLKLEIVFDGTFKLQTRCMYYENAEAGINGHDAPMNHPKHDNGLMPNLQFGIEEMEASK